jgi:hypothetical protein
LPKFEQLLSEKNPEKASTHLKPPRNLGIFEISFISSSPNEFLPHGENA